MKQLMLALAMISAVMLPTFAQAPTAQPGQPQQATIAAVSDTGVFSVYQATTGTIALAGTWVGTIQFEYTTNGSTWAALTMTPVAGGSTVTSATATGSWWFTNVGFTGVRVRVSAWTSGVASATATTAGTGYVFNGSTTATLAPTMVSAGNGSASAPSYSFQNDLTSGLYYTGTTGKIGFGGGGSSLPVIRVGGDTSAFPALRRAGQNLEAVLADESAYTVFVGKGLGFGSPGTGYILGTAAGVVKVQNAALTTAFTMQVNTAPTCTSNCGTSPVLAGTDSAGIVTMGASGVPASGWVVTFGSTWTAAPACVVQSALTTMVVGKMPIAVQTSTTTMTVTTNGTAPATSDKYAFQCFGVS